MPTRVEEFVGSIGDEIRVNIVTGFSKKATSEKGVTLYEGLDEKGRCFGIWSRKLITEDKPMKIIAKIWKHNSWGDSKSTLLNLVAVV